MRAYKKIRTALIFTFFLIAVTGCSNKQQNKEQQVTNEEVTMGKYIDEDVMLPDGITMEDIIDVLLNPEGNFELYTYDHTTLDNYKRYLRADGVWTEEDTTELLKLKTEIFLMNEDLFYGEDNKLYIAANDSKYKTVLFRQTENGEFEQILIPIFDESVEINTRTVYQSYNSIRVLNNGMIVVQLPQGDIIIYAPDGQSSVKELYGGSVVKVEVKKNQVYYLSADRQELNCYNPDTDTETTPISLQRQISDKGLFKIADGKIYLLEVDGVYCIEDENTEWEMVYDGAGRRMSSPLLNVRDFIIADNKAFYTLLENPAQQLQYLCYHRYDETVPSKQEQQLTIYSLRGNTRLQQAMLLFQESHPEVTINFKIADNSQGALTRNDYIRQLNTELLAGTGPDVLVLDGLPVEAFIEKGVLEDMQNILKPLIDENKLLKNITSAYQQGDKIYTLPLTFTVPVIYGNHDAVMAAKDMSTLGEYAEQSELPILTPGSYRALTEWFLTVNYNQLLTSEGGIDEKKLQVFLENVNRLAQNIHASEDAHIWKEDHFGEDTNGYWLFSCIDVNKKEAQANIEDLNHLRKIAYVMSAVKKWEGSFEIVNNCFHARSLIGMNSAGKNKELAKEFIELLFSIDVQKYELYDGFPVNFAALMMMGSMQEAYYSDLVAKEDRSNPLQVKYPGREYVSELLNKVQSVDTPVMNDEIIICMLLDEAERYLHGDITSAEAAKNAVDSIKLYLSE